MRQSKNKREVTAALYVRLSRDDNLRHYAGYIAALSMRTLYDENGNPHLCVDEELRRRLETKLITSILKFNVA